MTSPCAPELIDSHCHLDLAAFDADRDTVLARAHAAGVSRMVVPAVDAAHWPALLALCARHPSLHPALGLHPCFAHQAQDLEALAAQLPHPDVVAVGECGLDFHQPGHDVAAQRRVFLAQLELAREHALPVIVHARKAVQEVSACIKAVGGLRGVVHSFSGSPEQARQLWALGFHLGIGAVVTYPRARRLRRLVAEMPLSWLLLETDSPDQPACGHQGQRNEPARLPLVLAAIAALRPESAETIAAATADNARRLFGLN